MPDGLKIFADFSSLQVFSFSNLLKRNRRLRAQVSAQAGRIEDYSPAFDIGVAVHACGLATDYAQLQCVARRVPYLLVPCCVGKINIDVSVASRYSYPRAQKLFLTPSSHL